MAVDQKSNRHKQCHPTVTIDLADEMAVQYLLELVKRPGTTLYLHAAPPCGTASRAREKKLSWRLKSQGVKEPKPLRSSQHPEGLPTLSGTNLKRVQTANSIYKHVALICEAAVQHDVLVSIENPTRSWMWQTRWFRQLFARYPFVEVKFQACMHGGKLACMAARDLSGLPFTLAPLS